MPIDELVTQALESVWALAYTVSGSTSWADTAYRVAWCESRFVIDAVGALGEVGWMQIHPIHGKVPPDGYGQMLMAYEVWEHSGWQAWACY